jgi:hypothetical protein
MTFSTAQLDSRTSSRRGGPAWSRSAGAPSGATPGAATCFDEEHFHIVVEKVVSFGLE